MEMTEVSFDAWLRDRIALRGLSGPTLARQIAVPTLTVYRWLHGLSAPSEAIAASLADALGTTINEVRFVLKPRPGKVLSSTNSPISKGGAPSNTV
ncbi:MAG TPA: helix-turn-helix transcriptional regulator [Chloroflexota bacterium]|nr:helix-turn-helix transcriptional regulator [Chloroflexota bacterium]